MLSKTPKKKVFIGMSGGVDSSVGALLLQKEGYDVTGVFIKVWQPDGGDCIWKEDRRDAMRVAAHLGIKFITLDLRDEYKKGVVDYMMSEYAKGRTPNPDVMCNKEVKFGAFMKWAIENGADYVATGHYAQTKNGELFEGIDKNKDQSYFLWTLKKEQLLKILFPIGHLEKSEVRKIAEKNNIPVANKKDSQGVCFIGHIDMKDFIKEQLQNGDFDFDEATLRPGNILNTSGEIIGQHSGSLFYTIGERHGFNLYNSQTNSPRYYVVDKNIKENTITITEKEKMQDGAGLIQKMFLNSLHFVSDSYKEDRQKKQKDKKISLLARARYRQEKFECELFVTESLEHYELSFLKPQAGITPGQSLVLYFKEKESVDIKVLGGAII